MYEDLGSSHEVFPLIKERDVFNHDSIFFSESEIEEEFLKIESLLDPSELGPFSLLVLF